MSISDRLQNGGNGSIAHPAVKNLFIFLIGLPPVIVLFSLAIGIGGFTIRMALYGDLPDMSSVGGSIPPGYTVFIVAGVAIAIGYVYWSWLIAVLGPDTTAEALDQAQEARDAVEEEM